jgi:hypothetical protein
MINDMKTISLSVSDEEYAKFQQISAHIDRPVAQLIRAAMVHYRTTVLEPKERLTELPLLYGHRPTAPLPGRAELYDEVFGEKAGP